jgi:hypothetical protein
MISDNTDEFERLLNNYLPPIDNLKDIWKETLKKHRRKWRPILGT